jgi:putative transposase
MPNHIHFIIQNGVRADLRVCPHRTTNEYMRNVKQNGWPPFPGKLWQRNYYEHIIRNETEYLNIAGYIANNSLNWAEDDYYV